MPTIRVKSAVCQLFKVILQTGAFAVNLRAGMITALTDGRQSLT